MSVDYTAAQNVHEVVKGYKGYIKNKVLLSELTPTNSDVLQCLKVGAGMLVTNVRVAIVTASGGTLTATAGDGDGANSWDASTNLNATAGTVTAGLAGTDTYATAGKLYTAADTIDLTLSNNTPGTTGVFYIEAEYVRPY